MIQSSTLSALARKIDIGPSARHGITRALQLTGAALMLLCAALVVWPWLTLERLLGIFVAVGMALGGALAAWLLIALLRLGSLAMWWGALLITAAMWMTFIPNGFAPTGVLVLALWLIVSAGLLGGGVAHACTRGWRWPARLAAFAGAASFLAFGTALAFPGWQAIEARGAAVTTTMPGLADPGRPGAYAVRTLTYGSGRDRHRPEFAAGVTLRTRAVDASKLIDGRSGAAGWARTRYWGFDAKSLPLQARVWYPDGAGPFPIVLIVHGNQEMEVASDTGYAYLGKLFASRGFIAVSIDENFLNSSLTDLLGGLDAGLQAENDARGWLLLEHLRQFRTWNAVRGNPFHGRADLSRVVLIGHSRGGEAVAEAAHFNRLSHYPDDARVPFNFGFGIRGVIAIAPVDDQYDPRARATPLYDVSYLVIHGSHDGDVQSFAGSRQFARARLRQCSTCFKASTYVVGANHGQFNTVWGRADNRLPARLLLDLAPIIAGEAQRDIARSWFSAFLEATLHGDRRYAALFAKAPRTSPWTISAIELVSDYRSGATLTAADFEEDADTATGTAQGVRITAHGLTRWRELDPALKWERRDSAVALIAWERRARDTAPDYTLQIAPQTGRLHALAFSLAMADDNPRHDEAASWTTPGSLDLSVVLTDRHGHSASVALSRLALLRAPVNARTRKLALLDDTPAHEPVFQRFTFPAAQYTGVDPDAISRIALRFDRSPAGAIYIDDVDLQMDARAPN